jgi:hypothetical protein
MLLRSCAAVLLTALLGTPATAQSTFTVVPYGPSCGPIATGVVTPTGATNRFAFTVTQVVPRNHVLLIVGVNELALPIQFGHSCLLLTEMAFTQLHMADAGGSYTWSHALSSQFQGWARIQFAEIVFDPLGQLWVRTSNGLHMYYTG